MYPDDFNALSNNAGYEISASPIIQPCGGAMDSTMVHLLFCEKTNRPGLPLSGCIIACMRLTTGTAAPHSSANHALDKGS
jgi:hypothetical protein